MTRHMTAPGAIARAAAMASLLLFSAAPTAPAWSQAAPARVLQVPCCKCVDGSKEYINFHTSATSGWTVTKPGTTASVPVVLASNAAYTAMAPAAWVGAPAPNNMVEGGVYVFEFRFNVPRCVINGSVSIAGKFAADNSAVLTLDNGPPIATSGGFTSATNFTVTGIGSGTHVVRVAVTNIRGPMAMALQGTITRACPSNPVIGSAGRSPGATLAGVTGSCSAGCS